MMIKIMNSSRSRILFSFIYFLWGQVLTFQCPYKECYCTGTTILCVDRNLSTIPQLVGSNTTGLTSLVFDMNTITTVPSGRLPSNLTEISFSYNPITAIDSSAFNESADTLVLLTFWDARFTKIPDALLNLNVLKYFSIYDSNVLDWNDDVMKKIGPTVENMFLRNAGISNNPSWIQYFSNLNQLTFESCSILSLPDNVFDRVTDSLTVLSMFNNSLTAVPKAISKLNVLKKLNLANNEISNITWLPNSNLSSLTLNNNQISDVKLLSNILLSYSDSLKFLALQENQLESIPDLESLTLILKLDFSNNKISNTISGSMPEALLPLI